MSETKGPAVGGVNLAAPHSRFFNMGDIVVCLSYDIGLRFGSILIISTPYGRLKVVKEIKTKDRGWQS